MNNQDHNRMNRGKFVITGSKTYNMLLLLVFVALVVSNIYSVA